MKVLAQFLFFALFANANANEQRPPILDVHLHALAAQQFGPPPLAMCTPMTSAAWDQREEYRSVVATMWKKPSCADPVWSPMSDDELMNDTIEVMNRLNIIGVLSAFEPDRTAKWLAAAPERFVPAAVLQFGSSGANFTVESLRGLHAAGRLSVLGEVISQYAGIHPNDEQLEPYWAVAEELDIPVGIHVGPAQPGSGYLGAKNYRAKLHSALTMEEVLVRHPRLRVYLMHAGYPLLDDLLALLNVHPQVHVDVSFIAYAQPRAAFYWYLQRIIEAGFGNRVMFGSDQMIWPGVIERAVAVIEEAPFLNQQQKRDIFYNNAARFLRLSDEQIARHQGK
jgi:predicted TIM-barrel fold metal-dependent hydrolase